MAERSYCESVDEHKELQEWFRRTHHFRELDQDNCVSCRHSRLCNGAYIPSRYCFHKMVTRKYDGKVRGMHTFDDCICDKFERYEEKGGK